MEFRPKDNDQAGLEIPFWEDASGANGIVGYTTDRTINQLRSHISAALGDLGGSLLGIQEGDAVWPDATNGIRHGFRIRFNFKGVNGRVDVFALPIGKRVTDTKVQQAKRQALYSVWKRLESEFNTKLLMSDDLPLFPYMIGSGGKTLIELVRDGELPGFNMALPEPSPNDVVDGDFQEVDDA